MKYLKIFTLCLLAHQIGEPNSAMAQNKLQNKLQWKQAATIPAPHAGTKQIGVAGPVAGVDQDKMIVGGGANFPQAMPWLGGQKKYYKDLYVFSINRHGELKEDKHPFALPYPIAYGASCSTPKGIILAGGENESGLSKEVRLIHWNETEKTVQFDSLPALPVAVANASITSNGNLVFIAGGESSSTVSDQFLQLDLDQLSKGWVNLPSLPLAVSHSVLLAMRNEELTTIYLIGGRKRNEGGTSTLYKSVFQFELNSGKWIEKASLPYALSAGTGLIDEDFHIQLFGGDRGKVFHEAETLISAAALEKDPVKKELINQKKIAVQSSHPGFSNEILNYDIKTDTWTITGHIPFAVPVTTTAFGWKNLIIIPSGEIKAGVRSPYILTAEPLK